MKVCIVVLAHKNIFYIEKLAKSNSNVNFYIHIDEKANISLFKAPNVFFVKNRIDVMWGGFSQVSAILNTFNEVLKNIENEYIHLISGEDIVLCSNLDLEKSLKWESDEIFMDMIKSKRHQYRARFPAFHANKIWMRKLPGKMITLTLKILDIIFPTTKEYWFGSNWFSIKRSDLEILFSKISSSDLKYFNRRLNPDEHFFQHMVVKSQLISKISSTGNRRFIRFDKNYNNGNNPIYLDVNELENISKDKKYFFARKVIYSVQNEYYKKVNSK